MKCKQALAHAHPARTLRPDATLPPKKRSARAGHGVGVGIAAPVKAAARTRAERQRAEEAARAAARVALAIPPDDGRFRRYAPRSVAFYAPAGTCT